MLDCRVDLRVYDRRVQQTTVVLADGMREGTLFAAKKGAAHARKNHKHRRRTGRLTSAKNLYGRTERVGRNGSSAAIVNTTKYARFVEYPVRPHIIRPKAGYGTIGPLRRGQSRRDITDIGTHRVALRWYVNGRPVFARKVRHPGHRGFPFMRPALKVAGEQFRRHFHDVTVARLKRLWRTK
jgi:hypothetical protein